MSQVLETAVLPSKVGRFRLERVFVLLIDETPTLAFLSANFSEAQQLTKETWLKEDLAGLYSNGKALWSKGSRIAVRSITDDESEAYKTITAHRDNSSGDLLLAYLVPIDAPRDGAPSKQGLTN